MPDRLQFALYSPLLPPAHGGQPAILQRILETVEPAQYILIGDKRYQAAMSGAETEKPLGAQATFVEHATHWPLPDPRKRGLLTFPYYASREISSQAYQIARILREKSPQAMVVCTGSFYGFAAACFASKWTGVPLVPYIFDDYAYQSNARYRAAAMIMERLCLSGSAGLIVTNEAAAAEYRRRYAIHATVVHNAFQRPDLAELDRFPNPFGTDTFNIVFAGSIYDAHYDAFRNLVQVLQNRPEKDVTLHLFSPQSPTELAVKGIAGPAIIHHGLSKGAELLAAERKADLLFLPLAFQSPLAPLLKTSAPGKTAEYLALERPILVHAPSDSFVSRYFTQHDCGVVVDNNDVSALGLALDRVMKDATLRSRISRNAAGRYLADFRVEVAQSQFLKTLLDARD